MEIKVLEEAGHCLAVGGMQFSHQVECPLNEIEPTKYANTKRARALCDKDGGHNKFLESIAVWIDMRMPLKFWKQFDTYRTGVTKQSKSTMHSIMKRSLDKGDFNYEISPMILAFLNEMIENKEFDKLTDSLPEGYLQTRRVMISYKGIRSILLQREFHKLAEWRFFRVAIINQLKHPDLLGITKGGK